MALLFPHRRRHAVLLAIAFLLLIATSSFAQSMNPAAPTPVRVNTVEGRIAARDLGDSRLTDHYYHFTGTPGDLLITVNSRNLNGDIDVFTATSLRPLLKITLYAELTSPVTKGIYLRKREDLVMRIQARTPTDEEGTYRLFFGGSFEPIAGGPEIAEGETPATEPPPRTPGTKRVSSVGARIEEPAPPPRTEVAAAPTPEPTPEPMPVESPSPAREKATEPEAEKPSAPRSTRGRRPAPRRAPARTRDTTTTAEATPPKPAPEPEPETGPRLVIETNDGTLINRSMSSVRRVTVENGQVVILNRDGTINRLLLANVVRMSISP